MSRQAKAALTAFILFLVQGLAGLALWVGLAFLLYTPAKPREITVYRCGKAFPASQSSPRLKCAPTK